jgi:hypothetical protein
MNANRAAGRAATINQHSLRIPALTQINCSATWPAESARLNKMKPLDVSQCLRHEIKHL